MSSYPPPPGPDGNQPGQNPGQPPQYPGQQPPQYPGQYPQGQQGWQTPQGPVPLRPDEDRMWSMLSHILTIVGSFLAPLIIYLVFRDRGPLTRDQAREALNFQITAIIAGLGVGIVSGILLGVGAAVLSGGLLILSGIAYLLILALAILVIVWVVLGGIRAYNGVQYRYPVCIRFIKN